MERNVWKCQWKDDQQQCRECKWYYHGDTYCMENEFYCKPTDGQDCEKYKPRREKNEEPGI